MTILFNDFEAKSRIDLTEVGTHRYSRDPSTEPLMLAYAFDDEDVRQWVMAEGEDMPRDLRDGLRDPAVIKRAWNAPMEMTMWEDCLGEEIVFDEWRCTMVHAMTCSLPASLAAAGEVLDLPEDMQKKKRGKALINLFCKPHKPTKLHPYEWYDKFTHPEEWEEFKEYNRVDVVAERGIYRRLKKWNLPKHEWAMWALDQEINRDGIPVNMKVVRNAIRFVDHIREKRYAAIREIVGLGNFNPRSNKQLLAWLQDNGYRFEDLKKGHVERAARDMTLHKDVRAVLSMRVEIAKTSTDKYDAMRRSVGPDDNRIRGCLQFAGAQRTWRWSGRIIQPQNLARPTPEFEKVQEQLVQHLERFNSRTLEILYDKSPENVEAAGPMDMLATCIRPTIQAPPGYKIVSCDLNAIENRVLGYLSGDKKILRVFELNLDPYIDFATYMFGQSYDDIKAVIEAGNKMMRTLAKPGVLGCGYMLSAGEERENKKTGEIEATGLIGYAKNMGVVMTKEQAELAVRVWRETYRDAVKYWWEIEGAVKKCLRFGKPTEAGPVSFDRSGPFMRMLLPSGRELHYCRPRLEEVELVYCEDKGKFLPFHMCTSPNTRKTKWKDSITYEGLNDKNKWVRINTHPGKLTENADQAIARDIIAEAMMRFRKRVPRSMAHIFLHVHDEIVILCHEKDAEYCKRVLEECMTEAMPWASLTELPLGVGNGASIADCWTKD